MRVSKQAGGVVRTVGAEITSSMHQQLATYCKTAGRSMNEVLREWITPKIQQFAVTKEE